MGLIVALNELSLVPAASVNEGRLRIAQMIGCVSALAKRESIDPVRVDTPLDSVLLAPDYPIGVWRGDPDVDPELRRSYKSRIGVGPYLTEDEIRGLREEDEVGVKFGTSPARGFEVAYRLEGLPLSLPSSSLWDEDHVSLTVERLNAAGEVVESTESVRHVSALKHIDTHDSWLTERRDGVGNAADLWRRREELFPHLRFAPCVRPQMLSLSGESFVMVLKRLKELEAYFTIWQGDFDPLAIGSKCTPETSQDMATYEKQLTYTCSDNVKRIFSHHLRFTPGAGRIYFSPHIKQNCAHVGYIGKKFVI